MADPYTLEELKALLNAEFQNFLNDVGLVQDMGSRVLRCGVTHTDHWAPKSIVEQAMDWWMSVKHGALMESNANYRSGMGAAWRAPRYAAVRGPGVKIYSQGREVVNFEYFDNAANKEFNFHIPLFPSGMVGHAPQPIAASQYGWKLQGGAWFPG